MDYQKKYLKYKTKYLEEQSGGEMDDKTKIDMINRVNKENFCLFPFFRNAERIAIIKSSLLDSVDIIFNTQIAQ